MTDFAAAFASGRGRIEYVYHVCGMPWAVATSKTLVDLLDSSTAAGQAARESMFGADGYGAMGQFRYAWDVDVLPFLEPPKGQKITNDDAMSTLSDGNWDIEIADLPPGDLTWTHSSRNIYGLEGLSCIANPRIDPNVLTAKLSAQLKRTATALSFADDPGGVLGTKCAAADTNNPVVLWIGGEAMAAAAGTSTGTDGTATLTVRGILNTVDQCHSPNRIAPSVMNVRVSDQPLNGISNRPCVLWAFLIDANSAGTFSITAGPVMIRHGKVSGDASLNNSIWKITCLPWWKWLDTEVNVHRVSARLAGFTVSTPDIDTVEAYYDDAELLEQWLKSHSPHIVIREYVSSTDTFTVDYGWLCDPNESVHYSTVEDLEDALIILLNSISPNSWVYELRTDIGPVSASLDTGDWYEVGGDLICLLRWGQYENDRNAAAATCSEMICAWERRGPAPMDTYSSGTEEEQRHTGDPPSKYWASYYDKDSISSPLQERPPKPCYILQWGYTVDTTVHTFSSNPTCSPSKYFWLAPDSASEYKIWIDNDYDISAVDHDSWIEIGNEDTEHLITSHEYTSEETEDGWIAFGDNGGEYTTLSKFYVDGVGAGPPDNNYMTLQSSDLKFPGVGICGIESGEDPGNRKFQFGQILFGYDGQYDYWPVSQSLDIEAHTLGDMFSTILGHEPIGVVIDEDFQTDHVPWWDTIDWDQLDDMTSSGYEFITSFRFRAAGAVNLWELLTEELKFNRLTPTYEWSPDDGQYVIRFRRVGVVNSSVAAISGRSIDNSITRCDKEPSAEHASNWQINSIVFKANYDPYIDEFSYLYTVLDESGLAPAGGRAIKLEMAPRMTTIKNLSTSIDVQASVIGYLTSYLEQTMDPRPAITVNCTMANFLNFGVGTDCLVTVEDVHDPFLGTPGITDWPALISQISVNLDDGSTTYVCVLNSKKTKGWAPSLLIKTSDYKGTTVTVSDIYGDGQLFSGSNSTMGWYDHWFFCDCEYNSSMSAPVLKSNDTARCTLIERNSKAPTIIAGVTVTSVSLRDYTTIKGAAGNFFSITGVAGYDDAKEWWLTFDGYDTALSDFQRNYLYLAGTDMMVNHVTTGDEPGSPWE